MLEKISYLPISLALGAYNLPDNVTPIGTHAVYDTATGNNGVLVRNNQTGIYSIFAPPRALYSVNQEEAASYEA